MQDFIAGMVVGVILLQTIVFAPTIFTTLDFASAGKVLRALFPKFFRMLSLFGVLTIISLSLDEGASLPRYIIATLTIIFPLTCALLIPMTNSATDRGDQKKFKQLHKISVILTMLVLIANLAFSWV